MIILNDLVSSAIFLMAFSQITYEYAGEQKNRTPWTFPLLWTFPIYSYIFPFFWTIIYLWKSLFSYFMIVYFPLEPMVRDFLGAMKIGINKTSFIHMLFTPSKNLAICESGLPLQRVCFSFPVCAAVHLFFASIPFPGTFMDLKIHRCQILKSFWHLATSQ